MIVLPNQNERITGRSEHGRRFYYVLYIEPFVFLFYSIGNKNTIVGKGSHVLETKSNKVHVSKTE